MVAETEIYRVRCRDSGNRNVSLHKHYPIAAVYRRGFDEYSTKSFLFLFFIRFCVVFSVPFSALDLSSELKGNKYQRIFAEKS